MTQSRPTVYQMFGVWHSRPVLWFNSGGAICGENVHRKVKMWRKPCFLPPNCDVPVYSCIITLKLESICNHLSSTILVKRGGGPKSTTDSVKRVSLWAERITLASHHQGPSAKCKSQKKPKTKKNLLKLLLQTETKFTPFRKNKQIFTWFVWGKNVTWYSSMGLIFSWMYLLLLEATTFQRKRSWLVCFLTLCWRWF